MNVLQSIADDHDDRARDQAEADDRWLRERGGIDPEERRQSFHRWVVALLAKTLPLPEDARRREKLLGQYAAEVTTMVRQLRGRGWLLDGQALANEVRACVEPIAAYLRKETVDDPFAYFRSSVRRYVGANAEDIQALARRTGADEGAQSMAAILTGLGLERRLGAQRGPSMVEIVADHQPATPAAKRGRGRPKNPPCNDGTLPLL